MYYIRLSLNCKCLLILQDPKAQIGQIDGFSDEDTERLARKYENVTVLGSSPYATRSQFITLTIITLNICTHLQ